MTDKEITIKLTKHAKIKINQRNITLDNIKSVILNPALTKPDRFDKSLVHFIGSINNKFLRVIGRLESNEKLLVISAFFDRRLKKERT